MSRGVVIACACAAVACVVGAALGPLGFDISAFMEPRGMGALRAARVATAAVVGAALACSGATLQTTLRNPLADPYVLGVSGGGALGGALALALFPPGILTALDHVPVAAVAGAAIATLLLVWGLRRRGGRPEDALLIGVAFNAFAWAMLSVLRVLLPASDDHRFTLWLTGSIGYPAWSSIAVAATIVGAGVVWLTKHASQLTLLKLGDAEATRLGVPAARLRQRALLVVSCMVGASVALAGMLGFVGLLVAHACRRVLGHDERVLLPVSAVVGAGVVVLVDGLARASFGWVHTELPTGALLAVLGAPAFAALLLRQRGAP